MRRETRDEWWTKLRPPSTRLAIERHKTSFWTSSLSGSKLRQSFHQSSPKSRRTEFVIGLPLASLSRRDISQIEKEIFSILWSIWIACWDAESCSFDMDEKFHASVQWFHRHVEHPFERKASKIRCPRFDSKDSSGGEKNKLMIGSQLTEKQDELQKSQGKDEKLKWNVSMRIKLVSQHKSSCRCSTKVMKKQSLLFPNAIDAYFSVNPDALAATIKQFNLKAINNGQRKIHLHSVSRSSKNLFIELIAIGLFNQMNVSSV